jgi:hypothetical protein
LLVRSCGWTIEEVVSVHEVLIEPLRDRFRLTSLLYFGWVIPGAAAVVAIGAYSLPFVRWRPRATGLLIMIAGGIYVSGALGLEFVGGSLASEHGMDAAPYLMVAVLEEGLEIAGLTIFLVALARHFTERRVIELTKPATSG